MFSESVLAEFFSLTSPDLNSLKSIPLEPLVISCLLFSNVDEHMSDFTSTQSKKEIDYQFLALLLLLYKNKLASFYMFKQNYLQDRLVRVLRVR